MAQIVATYNKQIQQKKDENRSDIKLLLPFKTT